MVHVAAINNRTLMSGILVLVRMAGLDKTVMWMWMNVQKM